MNSPSGSKEATGIWVLQMGTVLIIPEIVWHPQGKTAIRQQLIVPFHSVQVLSCHPITTTNGLIGTHELAFGLPTNDTYLDAPDAPSACNVLKVPREDCHTDNRLYSSVMFEYHLIL